MRERQCLNLDFIKIFVIAKINEYVVLLHCNTLLSLLGVAYFKVSFLACCPINRVACFWQIRYIAFIFACQASPFTHSS